MKKLFLILILCSVCFAENPYVVKNRFNAGELSPMMNPRYDLEKYNGGCETLTNMVVLPYGGITKRPGTYYVASTKNNAYARLIPFVYSSSVSFVLEFGNGYIRFFKNGEPVETSVGIPYEVETTYVTSDLDTLTYVQSADVMFICHKNYATRKLSRYADINWTLEEVDWSYAAYRPENIEDISMKADFTEAITPASDEWGYTDVPYHIVGFDYEFGDACVIPSGSDLFYLTCIKKHTSDAKNTPIAANFGAAAAGAGIGKSNGVWYCYAIRDYVPGVQFYDTHIERGMRVAVHSAYSNTIFGTPTERPYFDKSWIGSRLKLTHPKESESSLDTTVATGNPLTMGPIRVKGTWWVTTNNFWTGTILVQRSEDYGYTWETVDDYYHEETSNSNFQGTGTEKADDIFYRLISDEDGDGTADNIGGTQLDIQFKTDHSFQSGEVEIINVTSAPDQFDVLVEMNGEIDPFLDMHMVQWSAAGVTNTNIYSGDSLNAEAPYTAIECRKDEYFSGNNYVNTYTRAAHNTVQNATDFTISFWLFLDSISDDTPTYVSKLDNYTVRYGSSQDKIRAYHQNTAGTLICRYETDAACLSERVWHHVIVEFEDGVGYAIYVDNVEKAGSYTGGAGHDVGANVTPDSTATGDLFTGYIVNDDSFDGFQRDIAIYRTNLSSADRTILYNGGDIPQSVTTYDSLTAAEDIVGLWRKNILHSSPTIPNERSAPVVTPRDADGNQVSFSDLQDTEEYKYGPASYDMNGEYYLDLQGIVELTQSDQGFMGFIRIDEPLTGTDEYTIISRQQSDETVIFELKIDLDGSDNHILKLNYDGANTSSGTTPMAVGEWYHVAIFNDQTTDLTVYLDALEEIKESVSLTLNTSDTLLIGASIASTLPDDLFNGHIDEWGVYDDITVESNIDDLAAHVALAHCIVKVPIFDADNINETANGVSDYTLRWNESAWSPRRGFPEHATFYDQRLVVGKGTQIWGSVVNDYENFRSGPNDDESIDFTIVARQPDPIRWMVGQNRLIIGTGGGEWIMGGAGTDEPITPSNVFCRQQSTYGSMDLEAIRINDLLLFIQRQARKVREFSYQYETDKWNAPDLSILAEHITESGIKQAAFQQQKHAILWSCREDGDVAAMTYEKEHDVVGWHHHTFTGDVESTAVIPQSATDDQVWMIVERAIDGSTVRQIEYLKPMKYDSTSDADLFYVDSGLTTSVTASNTISGLDHLEGEVVAVIADGTVLYDGTGSDPDFTVTSGSITIADDTPTYTTVHVGLPYTATMKTMPLASGDAVIHMRNKRISETKTEYYNSGDFYIGKDATINELVSLTDNETGYVRKTFPPGFDQYGQVYIFQSSPEPLTLLSLGMEFQVE